MKKKTPSTIQDKFINMDKENIEAYTPRYAIDIILPYIPKDKIIWCPFSLKEHNFVWYLRELGYTVYNTHFNPETGEGKNFLTYNPDFEFDIILDNPPFKGKTKFVKRAFELGKPFALFLPLNCLGDNGIPDLYIENNAELQILIPDKRTEFNNQKQTGISFKTIYICKDILPKQIIFTKIDKTFNQYLINK